MAIRVDPERNEMDRLPIRWEAYVKRCHVKIGELLAVRSVRVHQADLIDLLDVTGEDNPAGQRVVAKIDRGCGDYGKSLLWIKTFRESPSNDAVKRE